MNSKWRIAALILGLIAMAQGVKLARIHSTLEDVFRYDVRVTIRNKDTAEVLKEVSLQSPAQSSGDIFQQSITASGGIEYWQISGIAYEPRVYAFSKEGYQTAELIITKNTGRSATVDLAPGPERARQVPPDQP